MVEPPVSPAVNVSANFPGWLTIGPTPVSVGAPGVVAGVFAVDAGLHSPAPTELIARTRK